MIFKINTNVLRFKGQEREELDVSVEQSFPLKRCNFPYLTVNVQVPGTCARKFRECYDYIEKYVAPDT